MTEEFVTVKQVAERLHVARSMAYEWTRRRNTNPISHYPLSRKVILFRLSEVERWVAAKHKS